MSFVEALRTIYKPRIELMLEEHEEWCRDNPTAAAFLAALPNGRWRRESLAGKPTGPKADEA